MVATCKSVCLAHFMIRWAHLMCRCKSSSQMQMFRCCATRQAHQLTAPIWSQRSPMIQLNCVALSHASGRLSSGLARRRSRGWHQGGGGPPLMLLWLSHALLMLSVCAKDDCLMATMSPHDSWPIHCAVSYPFEFVISRVRTDARAEQQPCECALPRYRSFFSWPVG